MHDIRLGVFMDEGAPAVIEDSLAWLAARSADPTAAEAAQETKPAQASSFFDAFPTLSLT